MQAADFGILDEDFQELADGIDWQQFVDDNVSMPLQVPAPACRYIRMTQCRRRQRPRPLVMTMAATCNAMRCAPYREAAPGPRVPILGPEFFEAAEGSCDDDTSLSHMLLLDPTAPLRGLSP